MSKKLTIEEFIAKARKVHGDKYDYTKSIYDGNKIKIIIICPEHEEFEQTPNSHVSSKQGCPKCGVDKIKILLRSNINEFIQKAYEIHEDKYDYSKIEYINSTTKVTIICPEHGEFQQQPNNHIMGAGCPKCGLITQGLKARKSAEEFIENAKAVHGDRYDYTKIEYKGNKRKVIIICPEHGEFSQTPNSHTDGRGCLKCGSKTMGNKQRLNTTIFIEKSNAIHKNLYDYSKVEYVDSKTKVIIKCSKHGEFIQTPVSHMRGVGCPMCNSRRGLTYLSYEDAKVYIKDLNLKSVKEYYEWWRKNKPDFLPAAPDKYYGQNK